MRAVQRGPLAGLIALVVLLGALDVLVGLDAPGWLAGAVLGVLTHGALWLGLARRGRGPGPADRVTLGRCVLVCAVGALTVDSFHRPAPVAVLVSVTVVALLLDAVDGRVARRTGTVSRLGARFDMEVDALPDPGAERATSHRPSAGGCWRSGWRATRCALGGWLLPWLRRRGAAAALGQGRGGGPGRGADRRRGGRAARTPWSRLRSPAPLVLLAESFGREVGWLWRHRAVGRRAART